MAGDAKVLTAEEERVRRCCLGDVPARSWSASEEVRIWATLDAARASEQAQRERADRYEAALRKVSDIRDSIVGMQGFNFSEHAYPLVAVLDAAGFPGKGYEISRKNLGTLVERAEKAEARVAVLERQLHEPGYVDALREALEGVSALLPPPSGEDMHDQLEMVPDHVAEVLRALRARIAALEAK